jgi:hypothetical protein
MADAFASIELASEEGAMMGPTATTMGGSPVGQTTTMMSRSSVVQATTMMSASSPHQQRTLTVRALLYSRYSQWFALFLCASESILARDTTFDSDMQLKRRICKHYFAKNTP